MSKNTLIVNVFGVEGTAKSTSASYIFAQLKILGVDCGYVSPYFEGDYLNDPMYVVGNQNHKIKEMIGIVDVIVNDNPTLMGCLFTDRKYLQCAIVEEFLSYGDNNLNLLFTCDDETTKEKTDVLKSLFGYDWFDQGDEHVNIPYMEIVSGMDGCNTVIELILKILEYAKV